MPNVTTDEDFGAANILVALNESSEQQEVTDVDWSDVWNVELESLFKIQPAESEAPSTKAPEKRTKRVTSHRVLTSPEIIKEKRDEEVQKEKKEKEKEARKRKREENKRIKEENKLNVKTKPQKKQKTDPIEAVIEN